MGSFVRDKNEKVKQVFQILGSDHTEEDFINTFKRLYPEDSRGNVRLFNCWFRPLWRSDGATAARCGEKGSGY